MKILSGEPSSQRHPSIKKQHRQGRETDRTGLLDQALFTLRPARKVTIIGTEQSKLIKDGVNPSRLESTRSSRYTVTLTEMQIYLHKLVTWCTLFPGFLQRCKPWLRQTFSLLANDSLYQPEWTHPHGNDSGRLMETPTTGKYFCSLMHTLTQSQRHDSVY
jgi:hypothetical protein